MLAVVQVFTFAFLERVREGREWVARAQHILHTIEDARVAASRLDAVEERKSKARPADVTTARRRALEQAWVKLDTLLNADPDQKEQALDVDDLFANRLRPYAALETDDALDDRLYALFLREEAILAERVHSQAVALAFVQATLVAATLLGTTLASGFVAILTVEMRRQAHTEALLQARTERLMADAATIERQAAELARSNRDLEQFAYVASHDLQEPLRMVSSYTQLLERRYKGRLDADADEFIHYAVDGAQRMRRLIDDLLAYSRLTTRPAQFRPTPLDRVLTDVRAALHLAILESGADIESGPLPTVQADSVQMQQLFQNLLSNAIKYRGSHPPRIAISAEESGDAWTFSVTDNGIGIESQYLERVFDIFQRLHGVGEYPGTGIGLALCKKIVERHGGRIWVTSQPGQGSTFHFTLRKDP